MIVGENSPCIQLTGLSHWGFLSEKSAAGALSKRYALTEGLSWSAAVVQDADFSVRISTRSVAAFSGSDLLTGAQSVCPFGKQA